MVPLAVILRRQMSWERIEKPDVLYEAARERKKGEDFTLVKTECQRVPGHGDTTVSVPALFDGHNGFEQLLYTPRRIS
ncbi:unnamed protein product [Musa acuminata subsp. malaccensis]|uniref:(wild Malaysian banana) hypothetical protein n=1 Tax=Musa acuminata subsp. malaccensis TaxID=214687 RepID=A0A804IEY1_MUSAM|nr:unnamed protein product [Musa acuminata subsp. malaccensis]